MKTAGQNTLRREISLSIHMGTIILRRELEEAISLLPSCISGCARAQTRVYKIFYKPMFLFCLKSTKGDFIKSQDIAQEAFIKMFRNLFMLNAPESLHVWVVRVFQSEIIDQHRRARTLKQGPNVNVSELDEEMLQVAFDIGFEQEYDFDALVGTFATKQRSIFRMVWKGYNYEEIGAELNLPEGTVKSHVCREREKMKQTHHWVRA